MLNNLINSLNDSLDIELLAILRQIDMSSNNILDSKNSANDFEGRKSLSRNGL